MKYPAAKTLPEAKTFGSVSYTDDYQWLEEETPEVQAWESAQNKLTQEWFDRSPASARADELIASLPHVESKDLPLYGGGRWFRKRTPENQKMAVVEVAENLQGPWRNVIDFNQLSTGELLTLECCVPSPDGRKVLLSWGVDGRESEVMRAIDSDSGKWLTESMRQIRPFFQTWFADSSGYYYSALDTAVSMSNSSVFSQRLGAEPTNKGEAYEATHTVMWAKPSADGKHSLIFADHLNPRPDYIREEAGRGAWRPFLKGEKALFRGDILGDYFYAVTDEGASCGRLVAIPLATPTDRNSWKELIPGTDNVLATLHIVDGHLVLADLVDCYSRLRVFDLQGKLKGEIKMPGHGSMSSSNFVMPSMMDMFSKGSDGDVLFPFSTAAQAPAMYRANIHTFKVEPLYQPPASIDAQFHDYAAISADGSRVPYNVIARSDIDLSKPQPTAMYGYGGFAAALVPSWSGAWLAAWMQGGGVLVLAHLRGGGELGPDMWHQGRLKNKQNSFNDVFAIAEDLIARGITSAGKLGVVGGSNGGTMAAASIVQRPDLFRAAISQVPITDVLARVRDPITMGATLDYGDPNDPEMAGVIAAWSPYQNIKDDTSYPALFIEAGGSDVRCPPWHTRKFAARIQASNTGPNPTLMLVREGYGHGAADVEGLRKQGSAWLAFFIDQLGLAD